MTDQQMNFEYYTLIFTGVVAVSTVFYVVLTGTLVFETRKMRKNQVEPFIVAYLDITETVASIIYLKTKNIGQGVALNVKFNIIKELDYKDSRRLSNYSYFSEGVKYFPPNHEDKHLLVAFGSENEAKAVDSIIFEVEYETILNDKKKNKYELNLREITGKGNLRPPDTHIGNISFRLQNIEGLLKKLIELNDKK